MVGWMVFIPMSENPLLPIHHPISPECVADPPRTGLEAYAALDEQAHLYQLFVPGPTTVLSGNALARGAPDYSGRATNINIARKTMESVVQNVRAEAFFWTGFLLFHEGAPDYSGRATNIKIARKAMESVVENVRVRADLMPLQNLCSCSAFCLRRGLLCSKVPCHNL